MKLSPDYFDKLLTDTDPVEAVAALSAFWQPRIDSTAAQFGLSLPEYQVQLILIYTGELGNGGHGQFFVNRGVAYLDDTVAALQAVGPEALGDVLGQAEAGEEEVDLEQMLGNALKDMTMKDAVAMVTQATGLPRRKVYQAALAMERDA